MIYVTLLLSLVLICCALLGGVCGVKASNIEPRTFAVVGLIKSCAASLDLKENDVIIRCLFGQLNRI